MTEPEPFDHFDKFTDRARKVLTLAQDEAQRFNHNYIGTEHLLLGLIREREGLAATVLEQMHVDLDKARVAIEFVIGRGDRPVTTGPGLTPRARRSVSLAIDEAARLGHHYIGTEHLLLGLVREGEGIAAGVLESLGVNLDKVRHEVIRLLASNAPLADATQSQGGITVELRVLTNLFEEWKTRYDTDPESFLSCEAFKAEPPKSYGDAAARYFLWLMSDMESASDAV